MKKKYTYQLAGLITFFIISSCQKFVEIATPRNQLTEVEVFSDSINADGAILGIYINMNGSISGITSGGVTLCPAFSADELLQTSTVTDNLEFYNNTISASNGTNGILWARGYKHIYIANACIEGIEKSNHIGLQAKKTLIAEARFIRAFLYFQLTNLYGSVPLILTTDYLASRLKGISSPDLIYDQIISDLLFAQANLLKNTQQKYRVNYYAATAMLAKVYLYKNEFEKAEQEATKVIDSKKYDLQEDLNTVFLATSNETIWSIVPTTPGRETTEGYTFVPSSTTAKPRFVVTTNLYDSFEIGDLRKSKWIAVNINNGKSYPYPHKYKVAVSKSSAITENYTMLRLAEQYLIRAEARARLSKLVGAESAVEDLMKIRKRAGLTDPITVVSLPDIMNVIQGERRVELFCEWGNRWFDLKRYGSATDILNPIKLMWKPTAILYPIPRQEINANPNLIQNEGYN